MDGDKSLIKNDYSKQKEDIRVEGKTKSHFKFESTIECVMIMNTKRHQQVQTKKRLTAFYFSSFLEGVKK